MKEIGDRLLRVVDKTEPELLARSAADTAKPLLRGGWSSRQVMGHLIDSASNNHQRFVRGMLQPSLDFPSYDQDGFVAVERAQDADWRMLVSTWAAYNRYLAHVIAQIPESKLATLCRIGSNAPVTLEFLVTDYLEHLNHHLRQIGIPES
jgi:DinB superfamily